MTLLLQNWQETLCVTQMNAFVLKDAAVIMKKSGFCSGYLGIAMQLLMFQELLFVLCGRVQGYAPGRNFG